MGVDSSLTGVPQFDKLEIIQSGSARLNKGASTLDATVVVTHNLGYVPIALVSYADVDIESLENFNMPYVFLWSSGANAGKVGAALYYAVSPTTISFSVRAPDYAGNDYYTLAIDFDFKYYLLRSTSKSS